MNEALEESGILLFESNGILRMGGQDCFHLKGGLRETELTTIACALACHTVGSADSPFSINWRNISSAATELHRRKSKGSTLVNVLLILDLIKEIVEETKHVLVEDAKEGEVTVKQCIEDLSEREGLILFSYPRCWAVFRSRGRLWLYDPVPVSGSGPILNECGRLLHYERKYLFFPSHPIHLIYLGSKQ